MRLGLGLSLCAPRGGAFSPAQLANVAHWYRSDQGVTQSGGLVSQWNDLIGTAHLVQGTGANQPTYNATDAAYNGQPTLQASSTGHYLTAAGITTTQPFTIWAVGNINAGSTVLVALSTSVYLVDVTGSTGGINAGVALNDAVTNITIARAWLATFNGASSFLGISNWLTGGVSGNAGAGNGTSVGAFAAAGSFSTVGKLTEIIIQNGTPTAAEKTAMAAYLTARYGLTIT